MPPETRQKLESLLEDLPSEIFTADDSLGWVYQFWQRDEKERVNRSEVKIGADELPAVTQLFTEDYMVLFLLENTLGAWWIAKQRAGGKDPLLPGYDWKYLRLNDDGSPVAGGFDGWPHAARDLRVLDPSMGSGHFLTFALPILARMRMAEDGSSLRDAIYSALNDNLFGLELDARCSQIAAFNLALAAWRMTGEHFTLPVLNLACSGLAINASQESWLALAGSNGLLRDTLGELYSAFQNAASLGSLIDPSRASRPLLLARFEEVRPLLERALAAEQQSVDARELAIAAKGILSAARTLSARFTLVATNVPYLGRTKQSDVLKDYCKEHYDDAKTDLSTCFVDRCIRFLDKDGTAALVTPQNWLFQQSYIDFRRRLLKSTDWQIIAKLGSNAFRDMNYWAATTSLEVITNQKPAGVSSFFGIEVADVKAQEEKATQLCTRRFYVTNQIVQISNPDSKVVFGETDRNKLLSRVAFSVQGIKSGDDDRMRRQHFEFPMISPPWTPLQSTVRQTALCGGFSEVIDWSDDGNLLARRQGIRAWGRAGVMVSHMRHMPVALYMGGAFDSNASPIVPHDDRDLLAVWAYCQDPQYSIEVKKIDQAPKPTNSSLVQVPFDEEHWSAEGVQKYPNGVSLLYTADPTQILFDGHPSRATHPLQVATCRLLGYRWPRQTGSAFQGSPQLGCDGLEKHGDLEGIACLNSIHGEEPAAHRLRTLLENAYGPQWSASKLKELLNGAAALEDWLRESFFEEHCNLFGSRPFVWHVWDGRKDGFHALVNYHKITGPHGEGRKTLEKLIYTALGDWIRRQNDEVKTGADGAEARVVAAQHLQTELINILNGEPPYDLFIRWKPLRQQPMGWEPDINDGVRLNMRPWLHAKPYQPPNQKPKQGACILRVTPIKLPLGKDRGKEPLRDKDEFPWYGSSQERTNDLHFTLEQKRAARERKRA